MPRPKGHKLTEETKNKMRLSHLGKKRLPYSEEWRRKQSEAKRGKKRSEETRKKISLALKGRKAKPLTSEHRKKIGLSMMGRVVSQETREKISAGHKGKNNGNWKGGMSFSEYPTEWTNTLREAIRQRDNHICQVCGIHQDELSENWYKKLDIHHIDYDKNSCDPNNLVSLCRTCHIKTNQDREYWLNYFNNL